MQSTKLRPVADAFATNARDILGTLSLPEALMTRGIGLGYLVGANNASARKARTQAQLEREADRLLMEFSRYAENKRLFEVFHQASESDFGRLLEEKTVAGYYRATLKGAAVSAWTAFECLARDLFKESKSICKSDQQRNNKLDGLDDMRASYRWLADGSPTFDAVFDAKELSELEAVRHVVVHAGGIINQEYLDRTGQSLPLNNPLPLDGVSVSRLANNAIAFGCDLLKLVDAHVTERSLSRGEST